MTRRAGGSPSRGRMIFAGLIVVVTILLLWKLIDYRTQPPPPPSRATPATTR